MNTNIKVIVTDLDGTLLKNDKSISEYSQKIIKKCKEKGILFGLVTARAAKSTNEYVDLLEPDIEINHSGAITRYNGNIVNEYMLSEKTTENIIYEIVKSGITESISVHTAEGYFTNNRNIKPYSDDYSSFFYEDFYKPFKSPSYKISTICTDESTLLSITKKYSNSYITSYRDCEISAITNKYATKQNAINDLLKLLNIDRKNIVAFGDDYTDIGMLEYCGLGVAVENAIQPVKDIADEVCGSNENDGVAHFIEEFILT